MSDFLLSTKLYIPPARADGVARPRLVEKLLAGLNLPGRFVLLSGPAGFGKTTLLSEFVAASGRPVGWVSLDEGDNDPIQFWRYLIAACQTVQPDAGEAALALFLSPQPLPVEAVPSILINDLAGPGHDLTLVLDDYHAIQNESIHAAVLFLLEHLPEKLHIMVSTRVDPPWPLARFRARNQLVELRAQDLRFTLQEAASFLNRMMGLDLTTGDVAALEERTEGWVAGLQLAALSMKGRADTAGFVRAFTGSHVYIAEYLVEEVLKRQPDSVQDFLLQTSLLDQLDAGLCEAVTGCENGQAMLEALHHANLFVISLDDEGKWYRYHHLFADLLRSRLQRSALKVEIGVIHRRAAAWYEQAGMHVEAIEHWLAAKDYVQVVRLVEKVAFLTILQAHVKTVERWLQAVPQDYLEKSPRLNLAFAWLNLLRGTFNQAAPYLEHLRTIFASSEEANQDPSVLGEWLALQSKILSVEGKPAESRDVANQALKILPETDALVRSMVYITLATDYELMLDYDKAAETFQMIARSARAMGDPTFETLGISGQARMELVQGRLHLAFETASDGINRLEASGKKTPFSATFYGELSQIYYQWHQLDQMREYSLRSIQASGKSGYSDPEIYHDILLSKIFQMEGDWDAATGEMQKAIDLAGVIPPAMIRENVISQQVRVYLASGRTTAAQEILGPEGFSFGETFGHPDITQGGLVTHPAGLLFNAALRVLLSQAGQKYGPAVLKRGIDVAGMVLASELQCRHIPVALETLLIRSQMQAALGDEPARLADVARALELGQPEGFISIFVEEGAPVAEALALLLQRNLLGPVGPDYAQAIMDAFPAALSSKAMQQAAPAAPVRKGLPPAEEALIEPLTPRELEVLRLISAGDSNQAIAEKLVITVSAVKKHTGNIFGKLNVSSRTQAAARARQLGLLSPEA